MGFGNLQSETGLDSNPSISTRFRCKIVRPKIYHSNIEKRLVAAIHSISTILSVRTARLFKDNPQNHQLDSVDAYWTTRMRPLCGAWGCNRFTVHQRQAARLTTFYVVFRVYYNNTRRAARLSNRLATCHDGDYELTYQYCSANSERRLPLSCTSTALLKNRIEHTRTAVETYRRL